VKIYANYIYFFLWCYFAVNKVEYIGIPKIYSQVRDLCLGLHVICKNVTFRRLIGIVAADYSCYAGEVITFRQ